MFVFLLRFVGPIKTNIRETINELLANTEHSPLCGIDESITLNFNKKKSVASASPPCTRWYFVKIRVTQNNIIFLVR